MTAKRLKSAGAFTLVEVMAAILILAVAVLGTSGYRYYSALDARKAAMRTTAAGIGLLLCENWRGIQGSETYDPTAYFGSGLAITASPDSSTLESNYKNAGFALLGAYTIVANGNNYDVVLSWRDVNAGLRALNVVVAWELPSRTTPASKDYSAQKSFKLTTYTPN
jgi:prepilin-type N-terminal cleavage/methylation domain-containing protein